MPRLTQVDPALQHVLERQDGLATVDQLVSHGYSAWAVHRRVRVAQWQQPLPGVISSTSGTLTRRQLLMAAWLWSGPESAIDSVDACVWYGVRPDGFAERRVHVVAPFGAGIRSRQFVTVRRTIGDIQVGARGIVPYVDAPTAFVVAARNARSPRSAVAILSRGLQQGVVSTSDLTRAREALGDKLCRPVDVALQAVGVGLRSPAEQDARELFARVPGLPEPIWNQWLDLGDGGCDVCVDALWPGARLVHEVNGKRWHAWDETFEDMQARHDRLTSVGLIALHNSPSRIRRQGDAVVSEVVRTHKLYAGLGLPPGVKLIDEPRNCAQRGL